MRETAHEKGRKQLLGFIKLMTTFDSRFPIEEIGNAYTTSARTHISATGPKEEVYYDAVIGIKHGPDLDTSCYVESKAAHSPNTVKKLPAHLEDFLVKAYRALKAWEDDKRKHRPVFLFVTNVPFDSSFLNNGSIVKSELTRFLKKKEKSLRAKEIDFLCQNAVIFIYNDWLQSLVR